MKQSKKLSVLQPIKKYWYLCLLYVLTTYVLTQFLVLGSNMIANAMDELFAGKAIILSEFLFPFVVLMVLGGITAFAKSLTKNTFSINMQTDIRNRITSKLVRIQQQYFDEEGTGALMNKLISDIYQMEALFAEAIPECLVGIITVVTISAYIGMQNMRLFLVTIICYPLLLWIANVATTKVGKIAKVRRQLYDDLENVSYDAFQGILVGKCFNLYEVQKHRIFKIVDEIVENEEYRTKILGISYVLGYLVRWIPKLLCYLFCLYEVSKGRLTVGAVLAYTMLLERITNPMGNIPNYIANIREYAVSIDRLQDVLNQEEELSGTGSFDLVGENIIEFEQVGFGYSEDKEVLRDLNLTVKKGSNIAFVGSSGGGKSTVMKLLCGFYYPQKGRYRIYGHDFQEWDIDALRSQIGLVSQNVFLFPATIRENVSYGKPDASIEEIIDACKKANIHDFIMELPQGYETEIGERGARLSGGQKQRISIARAFLKDAPILLLDEPTSAVDVDTEQSIQEALKRIAENRTVITIAHRLSTIVDADEIYVFDHGEIVETGTHEQLLKDSVVYRALYQKEAELDNVGDRGGV